jgi:hypothetical protein
MIRRLLVLAAAMFALTIVPAVAQTGPGYGGGGGSVTVSASVVVAGQTIDVSATGFGAGLDVTIGFHSKTIDLGTVKADATGAVHTTVTIPQVAPGAHTITLTDAAGHTGSVAVIVVGSSTSPGSTGSGLAFTGGEIAVMTGGAATLLAVGGLALLGSSRKRRSDEG